MDYLLILIICEYYFYMLMISLASNNKQKHPTKNVASQMFSQRFINIHIGRHTWYLGRRFLFCLFCLLFSLTYMFFLIYFLFFQSYVFSHSSKITKCLFLFVFFFSCFFDLFFRNTVFFTGTYTIGLYLFLII